jgi:hypothetical protein
MAIAERAAVWQRDADELCEPISWLPFWRPRIVVKRGRFSPWFWPFLWLAKSGVFNLFFLIIVSEDILDCPASHRRAIIAHECGHLSRFHFLIWAATGSVVMNNSAIHSGLVWIGAHIGPLVAVGAFALFLIACLTGFRALLYWFEHQADDYAVARIGPEEMVAALSWLNARLFAGKKSPWLDARINRLRLLHGLAQ